MYHIDATACRPHPKTTALPLEFLSELLQAPQGASRPYPRRSKGNAGRYFDSTSTGAWMGGMTTPGLLVRSACLPPKKTDVTTSEGLVSGRSAHCPARSPVDERRARDAWPNAAARNG